MRKGFLRRQADLEVENAEEIKGKKLVLVRNLDFYSKCNRKQKVSNKGMMQCDLCSYRITLTHV